MADFDLFDTTLQPFPLSLLAEIPAQRRSSAAAANSNQHWYTTKVHGIALCMGAMAGKNTFVEEWKTYDVVKLVVNYSLGKISLYFGYNRRSYKAEIQTRDLSGRQILADEIDRVLFFTFHLNHPAEYWRLTSSGARFQDDKWARVTHIPVADGNRSPTGPVPIQDDGFLKLGQWLTLRMSFAKDRAQTKYYNEVITRGQKYRLVKQLFPSQRIQPKPPPSPRSDAIHKDLGDEEAVFAKTYVLLSQMTRYLINAHQLDTTFYQEYAKLQPSQAEDALRFTLARMADDRRRPLGLLLKEVVATQPGLGQRKKKRTKRLISVKKVLVTPTTLRIEPLQLETANRVLRQHKPHLDRFLRVQFIDERGTQVHASSTTSQDNGAVARRLARVLEHGIKIGSVHYSFLAFSSSQLREHGCWFFASTSTVTVDAIRQSMGDFSGERVVAKYAARMGQCFSSTQAITELAEDQIEAIPDIQTARDDSGNRYTFSDGVGLISPELAQVVAQKHRSRQAQSSSAFQFRLGGAKGVLTVGQHLQRKVVQLRPSQTKFKSPHRTLEINRPAYASPVYLNRQVILLLSSLGVGDQQFMDLLNEMLEEIDTITQDPVQCGKVLRQHSDEFGIHSSMAHIVEAGFLAAGDAYITNLIKVFRVSKLKEAKKKAKIHVPEAIFALGVLDETATLEPNQIFFQFLGGKVIQGDVILYRCPCLHPGDVRIVQAVDCPALRDLHGVVVFSQKGERDVPSMCSGGDLDGDTYSIIWDSRLFPATRNTVPMSHVPEKPTKLGRPVTVRDIQDFFLDYVMNDNLGQIANAHMALADTSVGGACAENCKRLAELHSVAVDFPKTGIIADTSSMALPRRYPDFMEKKDKPSYPSPAILGKMYRAIDIKELNEYKNELESVPKYDNRMWVAGMEKYVWEARELKKQYDEDVRDLMRQYGVSTEAELMSGSIVKWLKQDSRESFYETKHQIRREVHRLRDHWCHRQFPSLRKRKPKYSREQKDQDKAKAAAWYYVAYHPLEQLVDANTRRNKRLLSFPWVAEDYLCKFARTNPNTEHSPLAEMTILSYARQQSNSSATTSSEEE